MRYILTIKEIRSRCRFVKAANDIHQGGFPRSRRTHNRNKFPFVDGQLIVFNTSIFSLPIGYDFVIPSISGSFHSHFHTICYSMIIGVNNYFDLSPSKSFFNFNFFSRCNSHFNIHFFCPYYLRSIYI